MFCPSCGTSNSDNAKFCFECGTALIRPEIIESVPKAEELPVSADTPEMPEAEMPSAVTEEQAAEHEEISEVTAESGEAPETPGETAVGAPEEALPKEPAPDDECADTAEPAADTSAHEDGVVCPECGCINVPGARFCKDCGASMKINSAPEASVEVPESVPEAEIVSDIPESGKKKNKALVIGICAAAAAAAVIALILSFAFKSVSGLYDKIKEDYFFTITEDEEYQVYSPNGDTFSVDADEGYPYALGSMDKTVYVIESGENNNFELFYLTDGKLESVSDEVCQWLLSADGSCLVYTVNTDEDEYDLFLYKKGSSERIAKGIYALTAISADGKYIAYTSDFDAKDDFKSYIYSGRKAQEFGRNKEITAFSSNGKYIYFYDCDKEALYVQTGKNSKKSEKLGKDPYGLMFNKDCTELIFTSDGKTYFSENGKRAEKIASEELYPVLPHDAQYFYFNNTLGASVHGISSFEGTCFTGDSNRLYYMEDEDELEKIASKVQYSMIANDMKTLYFLKENGDLCRINAAKDDPDAEVLARDVFDFVVPLDGKTAYYITEDEELYSLTGKKARLVSDDVTDYLTAVIDNTLYFVCDGELCRSRGGAKAEALREFDTEVYSVFGSWNYVLVDCKDEVRYLSFDGKVFSEIDY